jgi:hypothetical protein
MAIGNRAIFRLAKMLRRGRLFENSERGTLGEWRGKGTVRFLGG